MPETIKVFEAFAGYGSQAMALERLQEKYPEAISFEVVGISEIEPTAIKAYNAVHGETRNYGDISKIDWAEVPDFDLFTYSFPCQDISNAGKQKGFTEGSGSRSSLLWECRRAIEAKKPRYLLMENVKNLVSEKFMKDFSAWREWLYEQGYENFHEVLNAKDYGVPQNRERVFMISILNESDDPFDRPAYVFPKPFKLEKRLKDVLEDHVPESYYLKEEQVRKIVEHCDRKIAECSGFTEEETERVIQVGNLISDREGYFNNCQRGRVFSIEGIAPCQYTYGGGNLEPKVLLPLNTDKNGNSKCITVDMSKAGFMRLSPCCFTPHTGVMEVEAEPLKIPQATKQGYVVCPVGGVFDNSYPNSETRRGRIQENGEICSTLTANSEDAILRYEGVKGCASRKRGEEHKIEIRKDELANCITSIDTDSMVVEPTKVIGSTQQNAFHGDINGVSPCINAAAGMGGGHIPMVLEEPTILARLRTEEGKKLRRQGIETFAQKGYSPRTDGISNTITTVQKDNLLQEPSKDPVFLRFGLGHGAQGVNEEMAFTLKSSAFENNNFIVEKDPEGIEYKGKSIKAEAHDAATCVKYGLRCRIRKLTERECFRLMDVIERDIDSIRGANICKTAQYRLAGNSIVVACLFFIFEELFIIKTRPIQATLF